MMPLADAPRDPAALRRLAQQDGYVYLAQLLPPERVDPLRMVVEAALEARRWVVDGRTDPALRLGRWDDERWVAFFAEVAATEAYRRLAAAPELLGVARQILQAEPRLHSGDVCRLVSPGALDLTTPPHQDVAYVPDAERVWTVWFPLVCCPLALGPLAVLPGSHLGGMRAHEAVSPGAGGIAIPDGASWHSKDFEVGDAMFFSALTVHRAMPNLTPDRLRVSVDYRYRPAPQ